MHRENFMSLYCKDNALSRGQAEKLLLGLSLSLFVLLQPSAFAEEDCSYFELGAEYLYYQPILNNDFMARPNLNSDTPFILQPGGPGRKDKFGYASGLRLNAAYSDPSSLIRNGSLRLSYLPAATSRKLHFETTPSEALNSPFILHSHRSLTYFAADLATAIPVIILSNATFLVEPGLHCTFIDLVNKNRFTLPNGNSFSRAILKEKSETWGAGPQVACKLSYMFCNQWTVKLGIKGGLLISRAKAHYHLDNLDNQNNFFEPMPSPKALWKAFPFWETSLSISSCFLVKGSAIWAEIGYEYLSYSNLISRGEFAGSDFSGRVHNSFGDFDLQGPYLSIKTLF